MSAASIQRIFDRYSADIVPACSQGRGKALQDSFIKELAVDFAGTVYLKMDVEVAKATDETIAEVWEWLQQFPHICGIEFVESVLTTLLTFGASDEQRADAERLAAGAYQERLNFLLSRSEVGGSA